MANVSLAGITDSSHNDSARLTYTRLGASAVSAWLIASINWR